MVKKNGRTARTGGQRFSKEAGNLMSKSSFKYSGIANSKTVGISANGKDITMTTKTPSKSSQPKKATAATPLKKCFRKSVKTVKSQVSDNYYRTDLTQAALSRYGVLNKDVKVKKGLKAGQAVKRGRGNKNGGDEEGAGGEADEDMPDLS